MPSIYTTSVKRSLLGLALAALSVHTMGQDQGASPYSAYGLGDLNSAAFTPHLSMGHLSIPFSDPSAINVGNPATYGSLGSTMLNLDVRSTFISFETAEGKGQANNTKVRSLSMGFPLKRGKWGLALGILPFTSVGYELSDYAPLDTLGDIEYNYSGEGGLNQFFLGVGGKVWGTEKFSLNVGANGAYVFGSVDKVRKAIYPEDQGYYNTRSRSSLRLHDFSFDLATYAEYRLLDKKVSKGDNQERPRTLDLIGGLTYRFGTKINAEEGLLTENYILSSTGVELPRDTIEFIDDEDGTVNVPELWSVGLGMRINDQWLVGVEAHFRDWRKFSTSFGSEETARGELQRASRFSLGAQFYPAKSLELAKDASYWSAMKYRVGFRYLDTYLQLNEHQLDQYGISFGLGFPLLKARSNSWLNIGCELGQRGTTDKELLQEKYVNLYFGLTLAPAGYLDKWFRRRKID